MLIAATGDREWIRVGACAEEHGRLRPVDAVLFDLDGVLVDSRVPFARGVNAALAAHGVPTRADEKLHRFLGPPLHGTFEELGGGAEAGSCVEAYRIRYRQHAAGETTVFAAIPELLAQLHRMPLVVVTSKPRALAPHHVVRGACGTGGIAARW